MRILIACDSQRVGIKLASHMKLIQEINSNYKCYAFGTMQVDILVTGIGSVFMAHALTQALKMVNYDMALNIGLAESFDHFLEQGFVVNIIQEQFADLGIDYQDNFYTLGEQELMNDNAFPFHEGKLLSLGNFELSEVEALIPVKGITVNALRNTSDWLSLLRKKYDPEIQTLTGASFFYVCMMEKIPFLQIRAISGFVEIRRVDSWNIPIAVNNLAESTLQILKELDID